MSEPPAAEIIALPSLPAWVKVWRAGSRFLSLRGLLALRRALAEDDPALLQGATTTPPPLACVQDWPVEAACLVGFCAWKGDGRKTVAQVEEAFAGWCFAVDLLLDEPAACRWLLNFYDETPRREMRTLLLPEVDAAIADRKEQSNASA